MTKIAIIKEIGSCFETEQYIIDLKRKFEGYEANDIICKTTPFYNMPLTLEIAIRADGSLVFRGWEFTDRYNSYLHTNTSLDFEPTEEQVNTVNGLFSGRIKFEGLKLSPGKTLQSICPINVKKEEKLINKKLYVM